MKRLAAVLALALLLGFGGARLLAGDGSTETVVATGCDPAEAIPSSGTLSLAYTAPSAPPHLDHDDYVLGGRVRWDSQAALDCIGHDADAAYEHEISFEGDFPGRIWRLEHTFPEAAQVYADELVNDDEGRTVLTLGVFRPEHLVAGVDYWFTLDTPLLAEPEAREHRFSLEGEIGSRICAAPNAWCVERSNAEFRRGLIDDERGFDVALGGCWSWEYDTVSPCSGLAFPPMDDQAAGDIVDSAADGATRAATPLDTASRPGERPASNDGAASAPGEPGTGSGDTADPSTGAATSPSGGSGGTPIPADPSGATTTTVASQAPPGVTTTSTPRPGNDPIDPGSAPTTSTPGSPTTTTTGATPTTVPGSPTTTPTTVRPTPTTTPPATPTTRPPSTTPPTTRPPAVTTTTRPPAATTTTRPPITTPPTTAPPTTPPTTTPPAVAPSIASISATPGRAGRVRVVAEINWPSGATAPSCITTLDGAVVSIKECGSRLTVNLRGLSAGAHTIRVRACDRSIACADSPPVVVTVD